MYSLHELYRIGRGPSSSHTIGPGYAARHFRQEHPEITFFRVMLFGSLGATGKGHFTDKSIIKELEPYEVEFVWQPEVVLSFHPNAMRIEGFLHKEDKKAQYSRLYYSIGGGAIVEDGVELEIADVYPENTMHSIIERCKKEKITLVEYVEQCEGKDIWDFLAEVWDTMQNSIERGLAAKEKYLPAPLLVERKAALIYAAAKEQTDSVVRNDALVSAYALAVSEENASMGIVVTAPTCGSAGVLPSVLRYAKEHYNFTDENIIHALGVAGILGLLAKHNASLSGAEVGCQGEIGVATSMAAGALCYLLGGTIEQIERAAEIAMEHCLGMTCDPMGGYVLIPCIERNANHALRAVHTASYAKVFSGAYRITYDQILRTMYETGLDMRAGYKETSIDGLAKYYDSMVKHDEALKRKSC